jgi:hypothetical protein
MIKGGDNAPRVERRYANRVSSAVWPASIRRVVATGKAAQRRRDWLMQRRWLVLLVDALSLRAIFILTTMLVVVSSLLVAVLGLSFWYLLLVPLLLFTVLSLLPSFLVSKAPLEAPPASLSTFAQEFKSSTGLFAFSGQEFKSSTGLLSLSAQELHSGPGYFQGLPNSSAQISVGTDSPATPMPSEPPLVRVLETYDLRETRVRHFFEEMLRGETGEHTALRRQTSRDFWNSATCPTTLDTSTSPLENEDVPSSHAMKDLPPQDEQKE